MTNKVIDILNTPAQNKKGTQNESNQNLQPNHAWHLHWHGNLFLAGVALQMILGIFLILFGLGLCLFFHRLGNAIQQNEYERQRFALLVAQELDRLDKAIKENNRMIDEAEAMIEPEPKWFGRN